MALQTNGCCKCLLVHQPDDKHSQKAPSASKNCKIIVEKTFKEFYETPKVIFLS